MSISKNIKKLLVAGAALIMVASAGADLNNVNAKRRSRYHYRTYRTYRRKTHQSVRRSKARKPKRTRHKARRARRYRSKARRSSKRNIFSYFTKAQLEHLADPDENINKVSNKNMKEYLKVYKHDCFMNNGGNIYGKPKVYNMEGYYMILTNYGLKHYAAMSGVSVPYVLKHYVKHTTKYWNWDGTPTELAYKEAEKDAINDLNQERAGQGTDPVTQDPTVQFIAEKREQQVANNDCAQGNPHIAPDGSLQFQNVINKYNLPATDDWGENVEIGINGDFTKPSKLAQHENDNWDSAHKATRDNPAYTKAGIAIKDGVVVEDFE